MFIEINTVSIQGIYPIKVGVQISIVPGLPCFNIVGLPDKTISESKERIRAALSHVGFPLPSKRITVNLSPAGIAKMGTHYDLPIALGILQLSGVISSNEEMSEFFVMGELALDASVKGVQGVLPAAIYARDSALGIICPWENRIEARISRNKKILAVQSLSELLSCLTGDTAPQRICDAFVLEEESYPDMNEVKGQKIAKRAIEIAAAGGHHILMRGPPGTGKSMLAKRIVGIMPSLSSKEIMEVNMIASVAGNFTNKIYKRRPFRNPHQSASVAAIIGGGTFAKPGEVTLAHNGILFLDEIAEFPRHLIDALRQVLESKEVIISRVNAKVTYPASFQLVAAMNPCRCGYLGYYPDRECRNAKRCGQEYMKILSGPILDRIDLFVNMSRIESRQIIDALPEESSSQVRERVISARAKQLKRYEGTHFTLNCDMDAAAIAEYISLSSETTEFLARVLEQNHLSLRVYDRVLKVARTIADLENSEEVKKSHVTEALYYRLNT